MRKLYLLLLPLLICLGLESCLYPNGTSQSNVSADQDTQDQEVTLLHNPDGFMQPVADASQDRQQPGISKTGSYTSKNDVALYIHTYGKLPGNYITKQQAQALGWDNQSGNLNQVVPGMSIGGDRFGNYEGQLPKAKGRKYYECDIDYKKGRRNAKRIVFSNDGLIYYTEDHYNSFEKLY